MTTEAATVGLTHGGSEDTGLGHRGPESKSIVVPYGFWLFVLSDMILFSALFATYASLVNATDGGPTTNQLFDRRLVAIETVALLLSSFTCGLAMIAARPASESCTNTTCSCPWFSICPKMRIGVAILPLQGGKAQATCLGWLSFRKRPGTLSTDRLTPIADIAQGNSHFELK